MTTLPANFRLGAHPDDIIAALRTNAERFKRRNRFLAGWAVNREYWNAYMRHRYRLSKLKASEAK
jgi:hypothetical protein